MTEIPSASTGRRERTVGLILAGIGAVLSLVSIYLWVLVKSLSRLGSGAERAAEGATPGYLFGIAIGVVVGLAGLWIYRRNRP